MSLHGADAEQLRVIAREVNETPNKLEHNLKQLKQWLACQPHLPDSYEDRMLAVFLRGCKHDLERAKRKLDMYYTVRGAMPELFSNRDPTGADTLRAVTAMNVFPLPSLTSDGSRVTLHRFSDVSDAHFELRHVAKLLLMIGDVRLVEEGAISGDVFLFDVAHITLAHCASLATPLLRKILTCTQNAYPQRLKQIHAVNAPPFIDKIVNLFKSLLKEKMRNRFYCHTGHETLHQYVPKELLPVEYGGTGKTCQELQDQWRKKLESYRSWFQEQELVVADESVRPGKTCHTAESMFGYEGAFRRLDID